MIEWFPKTTFLWQSSGLKLVLSESLNHPFTTPSCQVNGNKSLLLQIWVDSGSSFKEKSVGGRCTTRNNIHNKKSVKTDRRF